ncbi:MAG: hypothetical protein GC185_10270 [Alphaproteobacteria bacterium]|nr:hypothetical protein [Alphaproteobacteria bacterium]
MKLIGLKRLIILAALLGLNVFVAGLYFLWVDPMVGDAHTKLDGINGEISSLHSKIGSVKRDLAEFKRSLPKYQAFKKSGFMGGQDRFQASRDLDMLRKQAGLAGFSFNINDVEQLDNPEAKTAKMQIISSRIDISNVSFLLDNNFYGFLDMMAHDFPEEMMFNSFTLERKAPLDRAALSKIRNGETPELLTASATMQWITIVPQSSDDNSPVRR